MPIRLRCPTPAMAVLLMGVTAVTGCAANRGVHPERPPARSALPSSSRLMVMAPLVVGTATPGNVGRDFGTIRTDVTARILAIVRERFADAELATSAPRTAARLSGYDSAAGQDVVTAEEMTAALAAHALGATHLLVPTITEWREMRTDDPIGALILPHNSVTLTLRLMQLDPAALVGRATFHNRARLTLNQKPNRLLDDRFRRVVLGLLGG